jgi:hypothetical protein
MSLSSLDDWLEKPAIRTHHRRSASVPDGALWRAAQQLRLDETRVLGPLVRWRIPGTPTGQTFGKLFRTYPFTVLEEGDRMLVSGLCGRIWTLARDYPALDGAGAFRDWDESGTVRVIFAHWAEPLAAGTAALVSEARVQPVDRSAARRLRALWAVVGPFERLVEAEALTAAVRRAEDGGPGAHPRRAPDRPAGRGRR